MAESVNDASDPGSGDVFGAFNALLGYLGGQAATITIFDRFLWPQRHFSSLRLESLPRLALFYSMAGPLSPTALEVIDTAYKNGLFEGAVQGHMLGTSFYRDLETSYTLHARKDQPEKQSQVRNCIWVQALKSLPMPGLPVRKDAQRDNEEGRPAEEKGAMGRPVRARVMVHHLTITKPTAEDLSDEKMPFIQENVGSVTLETLLAICLTELSGIGVMIGVAVILRTLWSILFIVPLVLRLLGAIAAIRREPLIDLSSTPEDEAHRDMEIECPATDGRFMLISGSPSVINQFFRHYAHPIRSRWREAAQMTLIVAFGVFFPVSLLCQVLWMPLDVQYVWTIWQVFIVIMMHFDRYSQKGTWRSTTEAMIGRVFSRTRTLAFDHKCTETSILFGQKRIGPGTVKATLNTTLASSYGEGKKYIQSLVKRADDSV